jgi:hypothetical protein
MRINDASLTNTAAEAGRAQETQRPDHAGAARSGAAASGSGPDRVELSNTLSTLSRALHSYGTGRAERVRTLAAQYQSGQYRADSKATSRAMVSEALAGGHK